MKITRGGSLTAACILGLVGIGISLAHLLWPTPLLFTLFMIAGQGFLGLGMALALIVIFLDLRSRKVL